MDKFGENQSINRSSVELLRLNLVKIFNGFIIVEINHTLCSYAVYKNNALLKSPWFIEYLAILQKRIKNYLP